MNNMFEVLRDKKTLKRIKFFISQSMVELSGEDDIICHKGLTRIGVGKLNYEEEYPFCLYFINYIDFIYLTKEDGEDLWEFCKKQLQNNKKNDIIKKINMILDKEHVRYPHFMTGE